MHRLPGPAVRLDLVGCGGTRRLAVAGEIDIATAPDLARFLARHVDAVDVGAGIAVDLAGVRLLAAAGVDVLVRAAAAARTRRVAFVLDPVSGPAARALDLCAVDLRRRPP